MTSKRNRTSVHAGLLTALSMGVVSLAGCTAFNPAPGAPMPSGAPNTTPSTAPSTMPSGVTPSARPTLGAYTVTGKAMIGSKPLANATVTLSDAVSGMSIVAAGAGNYALAQAITVTTDANGNYSIAVPTGTTHPILITATGATGSLSGFATNSSTTSDLSVGSTVGAGLMRGMLQLTENLNDAAAEKMYASIFADAKKMADKIAGATDEQQAELLKDLTVAAGDNNANAAIALSYLQIQNSLKAAGLTSVLSEADISSIVSGTLAAYATAARDGAKTTAGINIDIAGLFPDSLNVKFDGGTFAFTDASGNAVVVTPATPAPQASADVIVVPQEGAKDDEEKNIPAADAPVFSNSTKFSPTLTLKYDTAADKLSLKVAQAAGQDDVLQIVARIFKADFNATTAAVNPLASSANTNTVNALGGGAATHTIITAGAFTAADVSLSSRMGGGVLSSPLYNGVWMTNGTIKVAQVQTFDTTDAIFVSLLYKLGNSAVTTNQGHVTEMETNTGVITLDHAKATANKDGAGEVQVDIYSRNGEFAQYTSNLEVL